MFGIPSDGWIALLIWIIVMLIPWTYSLYFIKKINASGVERWGAIKSKESLLTEEEAKI